VLVLRATTQTVYLNVEFLPSSLNPCGLKTKGEGGLKNEQEKSRRSLDWDSRSYHCGCRSRNSCYDNDSVPVARRSAGSCRNCRLHDVARIKRLKNHEQEKSRWSLDWDFGCNHSSGCSHNSSYDRRNRLRLYGCRQLPRVRSEHDELDVQVYRHGGYCSQLVPVACSSVSPCGYRGLHDSARVSDSSHKGAFSLPSFSFFYSPTNQFIKEFYVSFNEEN
jgi:hypothetical protein